MPHGTNGVSNLRDWEAYPENLAYRGCDLFGYNFASYRQQIQSDEERLFISKSEKIALKLIELNSEVNDIIIEEATKLEDYLQSISDTSFTRLILIPQKGSWGRLVIDSDSVRKLLTCFNVFPPFIDVVRAFGEKRASKTILMGDSGFERILKLVCTTAYLVKHVEEHGRSELRDPWSIRQMGIYHQGGGRFGDIFIIVNPSLPFRQRLKDVKHTQTTPSPSEIHLMIQSCTNEKWRWYISDLEKRYLGMKDKAHLTQVDEKGGNDIVMTDIQFKDTQEIQVLQDKCQQLAHLFGMDRTILRNVQSHFLTTTTANNCQSRAEIDFMSAMAAEADIQMGRIENLRRRLDGTIALVCNGSLTKVLRMIALLIFTQVRTIVDFRCLASLENNSGTMTELTRLSRFESAMMIQLTKRAARDTEIMKTLTNLALVYLPASFVSSMMGMGYISVNSAGRAISIHVEGEFLVFLLLTAVLLAITLGFYRLWIRRTRFRMSMSTEMTRL